MDNGSYVNELLNEALSLPELRRAVAKLNKRPGGLEVLLYLLPDEADIALWIMAM